MYENIAKNRTKTALLVTGFIFLISILGYFIGFYMDHRYGAGNLFSVAIMVIALVVAVIASFGSYYFSDRVVIGMTGAVKLSREEDPRIFYMMEGLSIAAGIPMPAIYIIEEPGLNAFATGRNPGNSAVVLTRGLINALNDEELKGVISHELSHIKNYDILLGTIMVVLAGMVSIIGNIMLRFMFYGGSGLRSRRSSSRQGSGGGIIMLVFFFAGIIFIVLSPVVALLIRLALSRNREYLADASGALITRYPAGLAGALEKISGNSVVNTASSATAHLFIANPLGEKARIMFKNLFNTHPPAAERIKRLKEMSLGVGI